MAARIENTHLPKYQLSSPCKKEIALNDKEDRETDSPAYTEAKSSKKAVFEYSSSASLSTTCDFIETGSCSEFGNILGVTLTPGDYKIVRYLDSGGIADVYLVIDPNENNYAAKILKSGTDTTKQFKRFLHEIEIMLRLNHHPHLLSLIAVTNMGKNPVIITEFANNGSLYSLMKRGDLTLGMVLKYIEESSCGLCKMHEKGFVHRDIKPHNILVVQVSAKLADFDLTREIADDTFDTSENSISGTINYISPEQAEAKNKILDPRSDIYSLGATMFHLLTGKTVFSGNVCEIVEQHISSQPPHPYDLNKKISQELDSIVFRTLSKDPKDRPSLLELRNSILRELNCNKNLGFILTEAT